MKSEGRALHSKRKYALLEAMGHVGIGKAWRKKVKRMASEDLVRFEEYFKKRAVTDGQWRDAWLRFAAQAVAATLLGEWT